MIILPDRNIPRAKFLMPQHQKVWRESSQAVKKDQMGNPVTNTRFKIEARLNDGALKWRGWFDSREDFDAFLWAIANKTLPYERELWDLPNETWIPFYGTGNVGWHPDLAEDLSYHFASFIYLSDTAVTSWTKVSDWNNSNNFVYVLSGGGGGGAVRGGSGQRGGTGGGGGGYASKANVSVSGASATYQIGTGGTAVQRTTNGATNGNDGGDTWFNAADFATATIKASKGSGGPAVTSGPGTTISGGAGGVGTGDTAKNGGRGGNYSGSTNAFATGGGGCAGSSADGNTGVDTSSATATDGGQGDGTAGGAAGTGTSGSGSSIIGTNGGDGTEWTASPKRGSGGGGGGARSTSGSSTAVTTGGSGGNYGGGGGGAQTLNGTGTSGAGIQGFIVLEYTPATPSGSFNLAMLGM